MVFDVTGVQTCALPIYGEQFNISDTGSKTMAGITNTVQAEEREKFLDFLEELRGRLEQQGYKQEKWKRS